jgi:tripartite-type tricarboxylate transporter receptor subunit TctC
VKDRLAKIGLDVAEPMTSAQMRDFVRREIEQWSKVVKAANIQPQ